MLIWLTDYLAQFESGFGVFRYLTLRTILSVLTSLIISFILGPYLISHLTNKQIVPRAEPPPYLLNFFTKFCNFVNNGPFALNFFLNES